MLKTTNSDFFSVSIEFLAQNVKSNMRCETLHMRVAIMVLEVRVGRRHVLFTRASSPLISNRYYACMCTVIIATILATQGSDTSSTKHPKHHS
jgi:hypothetical protein